MNNKFAGVAVAALLAVAGCAPQSSVVLLPDADGHVGVIDVVGTKGQVVLNQAQEGTTVTKGEAPQAPVTWSQERIRKEGGDALDAMPARPLAFQLYFKTGTAELADQSRGEVAGIVAAIKARPHPFLLIAGHADATGSDEINDRIARQRAESVRDLLRGEGVPADSMRATSHGKRVPLVPARDGVSEPRNRRVTVTVQ